MTSRDQINAQLRGVLDEATGKWGIRVNRVELKAIDPPASIQESMEKQMRADRDKRAAILNAEGVKQSQILDRGRREAERDPAARRVDGRRRFSRPKGEAKAIDTVFRAIHDGKPDPELLAYQYVQVAAARSRTARRTRSGSSRASSRTRSAVSAARSEEARLPTKSDQFGR